MKLRVKYYRRYSIYGSSINDQYIIQKRFLFFFWRIYYTYSHSPNKERAIEMMKEYVEKLEEEKLLIKLSKERAKSKKEVIYFDDLKKKDVKAEIGDLSFSED